MIADTSGAHCVLCCNKGPGPHALCSPSHRYVYYYAVGSDASGNSVEWKGDSEAGAPWVELQDSDPTGVSCDAGSSSTCRALKQVRNMWWCCPFNGIAPQNFQPCG